MSLCKKVIDPNSPNSFMLVGDAPRGATRAYGGKLYRGDEYVADDPGIPLCSEGSVDVTWDNFGVGTIKSPPKKTFIINSQINLDGVVEDNGQYLTWRLVKPILKDVGYGITGDIPATWIDTDGTEQMAVIRGNDVFLDKGLTGGIGEVNVNLTNDIDIISAQPGYTAAIRMKNTTKTTGTGKTSASMKLIITAAAVIITLIAAAAYLIFGRKK